MRFLSHFFAWSGVSSNAFAIRCSLSHELLAKMQSGLWKGFNIPDRASSMPPGQWWRHGVASGITLMPNRGACNVQNHSCVQGLAVLHRWSRRTAMSCFFCKWNRVSRMRNDASTHGVVIYKAAFASGMISMTLHCLSTR